MTVIYWLHISTFLITLALDPTLYHHPCCVQCLTPWLTVPWLLPSCVPTNLFLVTHHNSLRNGFTTMFSNSDTLSVWLPYFLIPTERTLHLCWNFTPWMIIYNISVNMQMSHILFPQILWNSHLHDFIQWVKKCWWV